MASFDESLFPLGQAVVDESLKAGDADNPGGQAAAAALTVDLLNTGQPLSYSQALSVAVMRGLREASASSLSTHTIAGTGPELIFATTKATGWIVEQPLRIAVVGSLGTQYMRGLITSTPTATTIGFTPEGSKGAGSASDWALLKSDHWVEAIAGILPIGDGGWGADNVATGRSNFELARVIRIESVAAAEPVAPNHGEMFLQDNNAAHAAGAASWIAIGENGIGVWDAGGGAWATIADPLLEDDQAYDNATKLLYLYVDTQSLLGIWPESKWTSLAGAVPRFRQGLNIIADHTVAVSEHGTLSAIVGGGPVSVTLPKAVGAGGIPGLVFKYYVPVQGSDVTFDAAAGTNEIREADWNGGAIASTFVVAAGTSRSLTFRGGNSIAVAGYQQED